jgi:hypothetical protein
MAVEGLALRREPIQVGSLDVPVTRAPQGVKRLIVGEQENDVGPRGLPHSSDRRAGRGDPQKMPPIERHSDSPSHAGMSPLVQPSVGGELRFGRIVKHLPVQFLAIPAGEFQTVLKKDRVVFVQAICRENEI